MDETSQTNTKLENITKRINRLLQDKYNLNDSMSEKKAEQTSQRDLAPNQSLLQAYEKTERMSVKLKQIRTLLGYQQQIPQQKIQIKKHFQNKKEEKATNLKNFVLSMRKKNQTVKQGGKTISPFSKEIHTIGSGDPALQQYTDASLKYINSFLPHQTFVDYQVNRQRKTLSETSNKQFFKKSNELKPNELKELQQMHSKFLQSPQRKAEVSGTKQTKQKDASQTLLSSISYKWQNSAHSLENKNSKNVTGFAFQKSSIQTFSKYFTIINETPRDSYIKQKDNSKRTASPLDFLAGKTIQYSHKSKSKAKKIKRCWNSYSDKPQTRETIKRIMPIVLPCIPKQRELI